MPTYRVELSKTGRAGCTTAECKKAGDKIEKGALRFGVFVEIKDNQSWKYKHWGCVTPQQLETWKETCDGDMDMVDGYEDLPVAEQEKVQRAIEQGHVDDADWKWDVEKNRPGQKGTKKAAPKKGKKTKAADNDEGSAPEASPAKKRGRAKKTDDDEDAEEANDEPAPKKAKGRPSKKAKAQEVDTEDVEAEAPPPAKKARQSKKKAPEVTEEEGEEEEVVEPKPKAAGRKKKADDGGDVEKKSTAKKAATGKAAAAKPAAKGKGRKKKVSEDVITADEVDDSE